MATQEYLEFTLGKHKGLFDISTDDLRLIIVMTGSSAGSVTDLTTAVFVGDLTTIDEYDGVGYSRTALANEAIVTVPASNIVRFTADDVSLGNLNAGATNAIGAIVYQHNTNDADSRLVSWQTGGDFPWNGTGDPIDIVWPGGIVGDFKPLP